MTPGYKTRRAAKHHAQNNPPETIEAPMRLGAKFDSPDELGLWEGGVKKDPTARALKTRATQFASRKNTPGKASSDTVERSKDYFKQGNNIVVEPLKIEESDTFTDTDAAMGAMVNE